MVPSISSWVRTMAVAVLTAVSWSPGSLISGRSRASGHAHQFYVLVIGKNDLMLWDILF